MGLVINLKADTGLVDRSANTTRFYKDIRDYKPFDKEEEIKWFMKDMNFLLKDGSLPFFLLLILKRNVETQLGL